MKNKIIVLDIETTGFLNEGGRIVELGICELDTETGARKIIFDSLIREEGLTLAEISGSWVADNSDIDPAEVMKAPSLEELREPIQTILNTYEGGITAFNSDFDFDFLENRGFSLPVKLPCPMITLTPILQIPQRSGHGFKWPSVTEATSLLFPSSDYIEAHRGASDAHDEAQIVFWLIKKGFLKV